MRRDISTELKELRLHGMAAAWDELTTHEGKPNDVGIQTSRWLIEHLLQAEHEQRAFASVRHQMKAAKFPPSPSALARKPTITTTWLPSPLLLKYTIPRASGAFVFAEFRGLPSKRSCRSCEKTSRREAQFALTGLQFTRA